MMQVLAGAILCLATGFLLVCLAWPRHRLLTSDLPLKISLAVGCGLGFFSFLFFLSLVFFLPIKILTVVEWVIFVVLFGLLWNRKSKESQQPPQHPPFGWLGWILVAAFSLALAATAYSAVRWLKANPDGTGWDSFAIWNLHARFLFRGGEHWKDGFSKLIPWSHPDYPLLLPANIAQFWHYLGEESTAVPATLAFVFTFTTVTLLFSAVAKLRGREQGLLAAVVLLGTPFFFENGVSQYADIPLSFFILATVALVCIADTTPQHRFPLLMLAGFMAGCAAWTKNEGLLFLFSLLVARFAILVLREGWSACWRRMIPLATTLIPILLLIGYFKVGIAPPGDLFSTPSSMMQKAGEPARYWFILRWFVKDFLVFGGWVLIPGTLLIAAYAVLLGKGAGQKPGLEIQSSTRALGLTAIGYFAVYVITPHDLRWHLQYSLDRLFMQLWPSVLFIFFMMVKTPASAMSESIAEKKLNG